MKVNNAGTACFVQFLLTVFSWLLYLELKMESNVALLMMLMLPVGIASFMTGDAEPIWTKRLTAKL